MLHFLKNETWGKNSEKDFQKPSNNILGENIF